MGLPGEVPVGSETKQDGEGEKKMTATSQIDSEQVKPRGQLAGFLLVKIEHHLKKETFN